MEKSNVTPLITKDNKSNKEESLVSSLSPREIVSELDHFVVCSNNFKLFMGMGFLFIWCLWSILVFFL